MPKLKNAIRSNKSQTKTLIEIKPKQSLTNYSKNKAKINVINIKKLTLKIIKKVIKFKEVENRRIQENWL